MFMMRRKFGATFAKPLMRPAFGKQLRAFNGIPQQHPEARDESSQRGSVKFILGSSLYFAAVLGIYYKYFDERTYDLSPDEFRPFLLADIIPLTTTTSLFRFAANIESAIGSTYPVPSHIIVKDDSCQIGRAYTPTTIRPKYFDLVVKRYPDGSVSRYIHNCKIGDKVEMRGLIWSFPYETNMSSHIGMIAGGTGVTPFYQLAKSILKDVNDTTKITLIYANKDEGEILLRGELDQLVKLHPGRFDVVYTVDQASAGWKGQTGYVDKAMIEKYMPAPGSNKPLVLVCGPTPMVKSISGIAIHESKQGPLTGILKDLGYTEQNVFKL